MSKRLTQFTLVATLGVLLSVGFSGTAVAEGWTPPVPDITLASPSTVELPATIVLSSPYPDVEVGGCSRVGVSENCYPYLVARSGPDAGGRYLSEWQLPMAPTGPIELGVSANSFGTFGVLITFTVTGNRFSYTDFRSCIDSRTIKAWVAYYAQVNTEVVFQVEQKKQVQSGTQHREHWVWKPWKSKRAEFPIAHSEFDEGYDPYSPRTVAFRVPPEFLPFKYAHYYYAQPGFKKRHVRARYLVKQGKKVIKRGWVSRKSCETLVTPPSTQGSAPPDIR